MSTPLIHRRRLMMSAGGGVEYIEYVQPPNRAESARVNLCRGITNYEIRINLDWNSSNSGTDGIYLNDGGSHRHDIPIPDRNDPSIITYDTYYSLCYVQYGGATYLRRYYCDEDIYPVSKYGHIVLRTGTARVEDNQTIVLGNNYLHGKRAETEEHVCFVRETQADFTINELYFYISSREFHIRKIEVYDNGTLIETFLPAKIDNEVGLYSKVQKKLYVL